MRINSRLNRFTARFLERKGKKDAKNNIIRYKSDKEEILSSPFFEREISLCIVRINKEHEKLSKRKVRLLKKKNHIEKKRYDISLKNQVVSKELSYFVNQRSELEFIEPNDYENMDMDYELPGDSYLGNENYSKKFRIIEESAKLEYKNELIRNEKYMLTQKINKENIKLGKLNEHINLLDNKNTNNFLQIDLQNDVFISKCKQHCAYTASRLSAYWSGVIGGYEGDENIYTHIDYDDLFDRVHEKIEEFNKV